MALQCRLSGATFQSLKLATIPISSSSSRFIFRTLPKTLNLALFSRHSAPKAPPFSVLIRTLSAPAVAAAPAAETSDIKVVKPQWNAAIDFKWIRDNKEAVAVNIKNRNSNANLELVLQLYDKMLNLQKEVERLRGERNNVANKMKGKLEPAERQKLIEEGKNLKEALTTLEEDLVKLRDELQIEAQCIPNLTHPDVPIGWEDSSKLRNMVGSPRKFDFPVKDHLQLGKELDLFDFDAAAEVYSIEDSDQCLIGTAEIPVGGIHMDSIVAESALPLKYLAFSHCFRTEAGAAGTATRGLYRVHQFSKVEMFILCRQEESDMYHEELIKIEEDLFSSLGLHFKILDMATGDLGAPAYRKFDVEAWMPGLERYGEISSASNCTDYQSRRLGIRYRPSESPSTTSKKGKTNVAATKFVHTLNATACAVPRMLVCLLENFQQEDGSVSIPHPLRPFMGGVEAIYPKSR
ncbi:hypothetical protein E1A91_A05G238300v1 [Gossypium mustelinum]|uniref:serine--tRNA ligase n=1 Tax=Gossypium mustelinum TaxID=34275 RepID=A0A5D2Z8V9_GOSMU|nr:hypothetical protein E1A91_A05G238300v1 [Gossypium mustelinum]